MIYTKDQFVTFWNIEDNGDKGNYAQVNISSSRKDKESGNYVNTSWRWVNFVGSAYNEELLNLPKMTRIKINGGLSQEPYVNKEGEKVWPKNPRFVVFQWELVENNGEGNSTPATSKMDKAPVVAPEVEDENEDPFADK